MRDKPVKIVVPYNFIPLSSWVFIPDWSEKASHDIPFADGISGKIRYRLKNSTPICVGHQKNDKGVLDWEMDADGHYVIPGTSVKGMLKTALEIVSFGRMECFHNRKHAVRYNIGDLMNQDKTEFDRLPILLKPGEDGIWKYFETEHNPDMKPICASVKIDNLNLGLNQDSKAVEKIRKIVNLFGDGKKMPIVYAQIKDECGISRNQRSKSPEKQRKTYWKEVISISGTKDEKHKHAGMFMFMDKNISNNKSNPKANQYTDYFFLFNEEELKNPHKWKILDISLIQNLKQSMAPVKDKDDTLFDWYCNCMNDVAGFPVWYLRNKKNDSYSSLGFCQVARHVYQKSVKDLVGEQQKSAPENNGSDLPTTMFGYCADKDKMSLGSRIGFSDLVSTETKGNEIREYVLGEPKSSFYPVYLGMFKHKKPYDIESRIAGRKIYKIRNRLADYNITNDNENVVSRINFVDGNSVFEGTIVFHNLKPEELGALIWVMSFGEGLRNGDSGVSKYYHSLGHAKAFGAGAVQFELNSESFVFPSYQKIEDKSELVNECLRKFERLMDVYYPFSGDKDGWIKSPIITKYLKYSQIDPDFDEGNVYNKFPNEFSDIKKDYENSPNAKEQKGFFPEGKTKGDVQDVHNVESKVSLSPLKPNFVDKKLKELKREIEKELENRKKEQEDKEKELVRIQKNEGMEQRIEGVLNSENVGPEWYVVAMELMLSENSELKAKYGEFFGFSNFNQFIKQMKGKELDDETLHRMVEVIRSEQELRKNALDSCKKQKQKDKNFTLAVKLYDLLSNN